jgi:tetratricopeptide (TPR) repeat protein
MMTTEEGVEMFVRGTEECQAGEHEAAVATFEKVLALQMSVGSPHELTTDDGTVTPAMTMSNLAIALQALRQYERMLPVTRDLCALGECGASDLMLHAIALHHCGDLSAALEVCERAIARDPSYAGSHHERACILVATKELARALESVREAVELGSRPAELLADDELAPLREDARFQELTSDAHQVGVLRRRLGAAVETLRGSQPPDPSDLGSWLSAETVIVLMEEAIGMVEELLETSRMADAPTRDRGDGVSMVDGERCDAARQAVLKTILECGPLWHAIPFLNAIGRYGVPNLSAEDARAELRLP